MLGEYMCACVEGEGEREGGGEAADICTVKPPYKGDLYIKNTYFGPILIL